MICYEFSKILGDQAVEITVTSARLPDQQDCSACTGHEILRYLGVRMIRYRRYCRKQFGDGCEASLLLSGAYC